MKVRCITLAVSLLVGAPCFAGEKNELKVRAWPVVSQAGTGCSIVLLTAAITGPETEEWYCPKVEWIKPDETVSMVEADCPVFAEREEFPRRWKLRICVPTHPNGDMWEVTVRLSKSGRVVATSAGRFLVR
jgi:hypothetical protein